LIQWNFRSQKSGINSFEINSTKSFIVQNHLLVTFRVVFVVTNHFSYNSIYLGHVLILY